MQEFLMFFGAGALGSLVKDIVQDGKLQLPFCNDGYVVLGFIGGLVIGGFVGYAVDHSLLSAAMAGYVGTSALTSLLPSFAKPKTTEKKPLETETKVKQ